MSEKSVRIDSMDEFQTALSSGAKAIELGKDISDRIADEITRIINHGTFTGECPYHHKTLMYVGLIVEGRKEVVCPECSYASYVNLTAEEMRDYQKKRREFIF